ncbi:MAG: diguanylate cyclase [Actinobacteria bacterium]|nr:MAG: diguanylate cyclase [Actinomycetota bacterium]
MVPLTDGEPGLASRQARFEGDRRSREGILSRCPDTPRAEAQAACSTAWGYFVTGPGSNGIDRAGEPPGSSLPRVLVVDDDPGMRSVIRRTLEKAGFASVEAADGREAVATFRAGNLAGNLDVVLLDVGLPDLDGYEVLRSFRLEAPDSYIPVIMVTGRGSPQDVAEGLALGAQDYLAKPFHPEELLARVNSALRVKSLHDALVEKAAELEKLGRIDGLTGIHNRRHMDEVLDSRAAAVRRHGEPAGALLVDIDHFKAVNDTRGHSVGDDVLRFVATILSDGIRSEDDLGRWGGEEFLVLLPATGATGVATLAARLRAAVAASEPHPGLSVTVSIGGAVTFDGDAQALIDAADRALYAAKNGGRDRVVMDEASLVLRGVIGLGSPVVFDQVVQSAEAELRRPVRGPIARRRSPGG